MSTDTPMATAPEMPSSASAPLLGGNAADGGEWQYFDNSVDVSDDTQSSKSTSPSTSTTSGATIAPIIESMKSTSTTTTTTTTPSSTAYSFSGSDLRDSNASIPSAAGDNVKSQTAADAAPNNNDEEKMDDSMYECNICLDTAKDAVVSMCGHLFCWPCLHQWLQTRPNRKLCPVCKAAIDKDKVIPLYGRNSGKQEDPRNKVPPRPAGQRIEPEAAGFQGLGFGDGFHMSFGIGAFPFGYFASSFNFGDQRPTAANRGTAQFEDEQQLSKLFLYLAFLCIAWLLFA